MRRIAAALALLFVLNAAVAQEQSDAGKGLELMRTGRYSAALPYLQRDLETAEARYGAKDPSVAVELNNLAEANRRLGRLDEAEALYKRAIALDEKAGPENAAGLATSLNNLALVYRAQRRPEEAAELHERSLALLERSLGPNHPDVARGLNNLATLYRTQGQPERARPLQERAVEIADSTLGPQHPDTRQLRRNLAALDKPGTSARSAAAPQQRQPPKAGVKAQIKALPPPPSDPPKTAVATAPASAAPSGVFALQLAAVPEASQVAAEWKRLAGRFSVLKEFDLQPAQAVEIAGKGTFYRVLAGPFASRAEAEATCSRLRKAGGTCRLARQ